MPQGHITLTPSTTVEAGANLLIEYENATKANQLVTLTAHNSGGLSEEIQIQLDGQGKGCVYWTVPVTGWTTATVEDDLDAPPQSVAVIAPGGGEV